MSKKGFDIGNWEVVMGLEVHCQLSTKYKLFCDCLNEESTEPNKNICPICMGYPGVLPKLNPEAVAFAVKAATAVNCTINETSEFSRKHYFYPDLPKGYQITQFEFPIAEHGKVGIGAPMPDGFSKQIPIARIHMEEDAGKNVHLETASYVNFNRASVPLIEIVTAPFVGEPQDASQYVRHLHWILLSSGITLGSLEEGHLRCDVNVSVRPKGEKDLRTRVEVKNLNSFRYIERAVIAEAKRQIALYDKGKKPILETRLYNQKTSDTQSMRSKEEAMDYRYFPEPDLPLLKLDPAWIQKHSFQSTVLKEKSDLMLQSHADEKQANTFMANPVLKQLFYDTVELGGSPKSVKDWVLTTVLEHTKDEKMPVSPKQLLEFITLVDQQTINQLVAKDIFKQIAFTDASPQAWVKEKGLEMTSSEDDIMPQVKEMLKSHPEEWQRFCSGDDKLLKFFMGQVMRITKGKINPKVAAEIIQSIRVKAG
jgi:aspartyl-tRNA(Asn)/glutamyl-tRNA(Gln) amidotransferase subunit B